MKRKSIFVEARIGDPRLVSPLRSYLSRARLSWASQSDVVSASGSGTRKPASNASARFRHAKVDAPVTTCSYPEVNCGHGAEGRFVGGGACDR